MKKQLAFGTLLLLSSHLVAPIALAQDAAAGDAQSTPPAGQTVDPGQTAEPDQVEEEVEISAPGASDSSEDIVVVGRNIPNVIRATPQVISVLSTADIERTGEGDIAGALQRVTGLSVVGNGFVYVRGLGDRYSSSLLNGSPLPSPEPLRRVVPLDIFPTNLVASALVQKSASANYPGEFGGGVINLTTRAVPKESFLDFGGSVGFDTVTSSELGYVYDGGSADVFGYDDGERSVPGFINEAGRNITSINSFSQLATLSNAPTTLLQEQAQLPANWSGEVSAGTSFDVGATRIGLIAAGGISNGWRTRDAIQQTTDDGTGAGINRDFRTVLTDNRIIVNGLIGIGAEFGEQRVRLTNLYVHDTLKQGRLGAGTGSNIGGFIDGNAPFIEQNTNWFERQLFTTQFVGEFEIGQLNIDVRGAYANTKRESPYERAFRYEYSPVVGDYVNNLGGSSNQSATVSFNDLNEDLWSGAVDFSYELNFDRPITVSAGYAYQDSDRSSSRYEFRYRARGGALGLAFSQLRPDFLLSDFNILNGCDRAALNLAADESCIFLENQSTQLGAAAYDASLRIHGVYAQLEGEIVDGMRITAGVRYEDAIEEVLPSGGNVPATLIANDYWLPSATLTWNFASDMQLRLHTSVTVARPQFRELARQIYQDYESDRQFLGNPFLIDSQLWNSEARFEWFFAREQRLTVAGFYKRIQNPIEQVSFFPAGTDAIQTGFSNAPAAQLYGGEIEAVKYVPLDTLGDFFASRRLLLLANYTYTQSELIIGNQGVPDPLNNLLRPANLLFQDGAPLTGQSDHLVNLQLGIEDTKSLSQLTVLFNYASERVTNRGPTSASGGVRLPDLTERPGIRLDVVARQGIRFGEREFELKFEGRNLTGTRYQEFQDFGNGVRIDNNTYDLGRIFTVGLTAKL